MPSLGELFISLGFDVDNTKLKEFQSGLRNTQETMLKLETVTTATVGALSLFVQHASEGAVRLNNMATLMGTNTQAAQTFANALHQVNAAISVTEGQQKWGQFSNFINSAIVQGKGGEAAGALARLGVNWSENLTPENALEQMRDNLPVILKTLSNDPVKQLAIQSDLLKTIPGLEGSGNVLRESREQYQAASEFNIVQKNIEALTRFAATTAKLDEAFNKLSTDVASHIESPLAKMIDTFADGVMQWDKQVEGASDRPIQINKMTAQQQAAKSSDFWNFITSPSKWGELFSMSTTPVLSSNLSPGVMRRLQEESGLNPNQYGKGVGERKGEWHEAYGIAQTDPTRQASFARVMGHDIHGSSLAEQEQFVNWELMHGDPGARRAGREMAKTQDENERYKIFTKYFERPAGSEKIVIHLHSNSKNNEELAHMIDNRLQNMINRTHAQTNNGAQQ